jgi:hypothetical protein
LRQALHERGVAGLKFRIIRGRGHEHADAPHSPGLLCARRQRPSGGCAAEEGDELPPLHCFEPSRAFNRNG